MAEQMNQPMILREPHSLGIAEILKTSFKFSGRNGKSMIINMFIVFIPFCLLILGADLTFVRIMTSVFMPMELLAGVDPCSVEAKEMVGGIIKNVWLLLGLQLFFIAFFSIASLFSIIAMVCISSMQSQKRLKMKDLFMKTGRPWIRQVITWFYVTFIVLLAAAFILISIGVLSARVTGMAMIVSCILVIIFGTLGYVYLAAVWMLSMVMSVADMDFNEVQESKELTEEKRLQGFVLVLFASLIGIGICVAFAFVTRRIDRGLDSRSTNGIVMLCYLSWMKLFMFILYGVYYKEFKRRNHGSGYDVEQRLNYVEILV